MSEEVTCPYCYGKIELEVKLAPRFPASEIRVKCDNCGWADYLPEAKTMPDHTVACPRCGDQEISTDFVAMGVKTR